MTRCLKSSRAYLRRTTALRVTVLGTSRTKTNFESKNHTVVHRAMWRNSRIGEVVFLSSLDPTAVFNSRNWSMNFTWLGLKFWRMVSGCPAVSLTSSRHAPVINAAAPAPALCEQLSVACSKEVTIWRIRRWARWRPKTLARARPTPCALPSSQDSFRRNWPGLAPRHHIQVGPAPSSIRAPLKGPNFSNLGGNPMNLSVATTTGLTRFPSIFLLARRFPLPAQLMDLWFPLPRVAKTMM